MATSAVFLGPVAMAIFTWEHVGRKRQSRFRPSVMITKATAKSAKMFSQIGKMAAQLSSFYAKIDPMVLVRFIQDLYQTAHELLEPTIHLMTTPVHLLRSYYQTAKTYGYPVLVGLGSVTVLLAGGMAYAYIPQMRTHVSNILGQLPVVVKKTLHHV
uniref:Uncharacterized protein n=1 Tax=Clandestinovirus TaxID=2831644 RepID=A0A8F8PR99_9VIRU|nr:hypothetical protein KOM_12_596 [Clandestinovirus]